MVKANEYNKAWVNQFFWRTKDQAEIDYIEEENETLHCYEMTWSEKRKKQLSKSFQASYPNHNFKVITKENFEEFVQ